MTTTDLKENAEKLGFRKLDTANTVNELNTAIATYQVFFHKLQNFHWNVVGSDFFDIHDITQEMYETALEDIDELAERVRIFGKVPVYKMNDYLEVSLIKESPNDLSGEYMARKIAQDIQVLIETLIGFYDAAADNGDIGSAHMASKMVKKLETNHWKLNAWCDRRFRVS